MPSQYPHPSLTIDGWTKSSIHVADQMLSDFFLSEYSQTATWPDKVKSFPWLVQRYADDASQLALQVQEHLRNYFSQQFTEVQVEVTAINDVDSVNTNSLSFFMTFVDNAGETFNLNRLLRYSNLKIVEIVNILKG